MYLASSFIYCRENTYDTVDLNESASLSHHIAMETNPAYGVYVHTQWLYTVVEDAYVRMWFKYELLQDVKTF